MKITCLLENTTSRDTLTPKHGLSLFIETLNHNLLFDMGPDGTFLDNARSLDIDPAKADIAVISHGHWDHGGGIPWFQKINKTAPIFMTQKAMGKFHVRVPGTASRYIGLDHGAITPAQCRFITTDLRLSDSLQIFTGFSAPGFIPRGNDVLYTETDDGKKENDGFCHELALLIRENGKRVLITGCSHSGIGNMLTTVLNRTGLEKIDMVIGGFHLYNPATRQTESNSRLDLLAQELSSHPDTRFCTGHCTGPDAPAYLNRVMPNPLVTLSTGNQFQI